MTIERSTRRVASKRLAAIATELLDASVLCAIATVSSRNGARINTAYFAWGDDFRCVWLSHPDADHSRNIQLNPSVAIAVYDSAQTWGTPDRGIQLFGRARQATGAGAQTALEVYADRFEAFLPGELSAYRPYEFRPGRLKLFDEHTLGGGVFVTARVGAGGALAWERTDLYHSDEPGA